MGAILIIFELEVLGIGEKLSTCIKRMKLAYCLYGEDQGRVSAMTRVKD